MTPSLMLNLRAAGWVPHRLVCECNGKLVEVISYPFASDDGESVLVYGRRTPGDPTTNVLWILLGQKDTGVRDLRHVTAVCPNCKHKWEPKCSGELRNCHVDCPNCCYTFSAVYDNTRFVGFSFHEEMLKFQSKTWK